MRRWRRAFAVVAALVVIAVNCAPARADGDPASDVLVSQVAFLPADAGFSAAQQAQLTGLLKTAAGAGHPVRVAIIPDAYDLGSITVLWRRPETYARFLGAELSLVYKHPLVVVMPNGLGLNWPGHSTANARRQLASVTVRPGDAGLFDAAVTAVQRLLSASHVHISGGAGAPVAAGTSPRPRSGGATAGSDGGNSLWLIVSASLVVLVATAVLAIRMLRARLLQGEASATVAHPGVVASTTPSRLRWLLPAGIGALAVATGGGVLAGSLLRGSLAGSGQAGGDGDGDGDGDTVHASGGPAAGPRLHSARPERPPPVIGLVPGT